MTSSPRRGTRRHIRTRVARSLRSAGFAMDCMGSGLDPPHPVSQQALSGSVPGRIRALRAGVPPGSAIAAGGPAVRPGTERVPVVGGSPARAVKTVRRRNRSSDCCDDPGVVIVAGRSGGLLAVRLDQPLGELGDVARLGQVPLAELVSQLGLGQALVALGVQVEHALAHVGHWQGRRARYCGTRKNLFDLRRVAVVHNLHVIARQPGGSQYQLTA